jgi:hypothetical protein
MRRFHPGGVQQSLTQLVSLSALAIILMTVGNLAACGGHRPAGSSQAPAKITLSPASSTSVQIGNTLTFTAPTPSSRATLRS